jgi:hypothetical protein
MAGEETRATKPNNNDDKFIALASPAIKEISINHSWWKTVTPG